MTAIRILVLGGKAVLVRKAADLGYEVVHVQKPSAFDPEVVPLCAQVLLVDYQDVPTVTALVSALHEQRPFSRVFTQTEAAQVVAGHITDTLGLPGNSARTNRLLHDKPALRALLNTQGIGPVPTLTAPSHEGLRDFVEEHGGAVLKPTMGSGSLGVRKIHSVAEVDEAWAWHEEFGVGDFMVEQLLTGQELSVESFSEGGRHTIVAITGKDTGVGVVELGHVVPAPITGEEQESVGELVRSLLDAVGLLDGPAHTEVILTADGPRVIESHSRCGGDNINDLVRLVHGIDMEEATYALAERDEPLSGPYPAEGAAAIRFLVAEPGRVTAVTGVDEARAAEGVFRVAVPLEIGDTVHELRWSEDRCGYVMTYAADASTAERLAAAAAAHITITTDPADQAAHGRATLGDILGEVDEELNPFAGAAAP